MKSLPQNEDTPTHESEPFSVLPVPVQEEVQQPDPEYVDFDPEYGVKQELLEPKLENTSPDYYELVKRQMINKNANEALKDIAQSSQKKSTPQGRIRRLLDNASGLSTIRKRTLTPQRIQTHAHQRLHAHNHHKLIHTRTKHIRLQRQ